MLRLLTNPLALRVLAVSVIAVSALVLFAWILRRLRRGIEQATVMKGAGNPADLAAAAYQGLIRKYQQQEQEMLRSREQQQQQAAASALITTTILEQLATAVVVFNRMGLVQQVNPAAKVIFGYASPLNLHARDLLRGVAGLREESGAESGESVAEIIEKLLREGGNPARLRAEYVTPQGARRRLRLVLAGVNAEGKVTAVVCLADALAEAPGAAAVAAR